MKKWMKIIPILCFCIQIIGCKNNIQLPDKADQIVLMNDQNYLILDKEWNILKQIKRPKRNSNTYYSFRFEEVNSNCIGGPCIGFPGSEFYFESIDLDRYEVNNILLPTTSLNSFCLNGDRIATIDNRTPSRMINECNLEGELIQQKPFTYFDTNPQLLVDYQLIPDPSGYYLLCSLIPEGTVGDYIENHILHFNSDLQIDMDIDLGVYDGGCYSMAIMPETQTAYVVQTSEGLDFATREPGLSDNLFVVDLSAQQVIEHIDLGYYGSNGIEIDPDTKQLIIRLTSFNKTDNVQFILFDPITYAMNTIEFDQAILDGEFLNPMFSKQNGLYLILFENCLITYDPELQTQNIMNLNAYGVENARAIWCGSNTITKESTNL